MKKIFSPIFIFAIALLFSPIFSSAFSSLNQAQASENVSADSDAKNLQWNSAEGLKRLERSKIKNDFYQLANFYQPQANPLYCGIASSVIILNAIDSFDVSSDKIINKITSQKAIEVQKPQSMGGGIVEFHSYSQATFLNAETDKIKKREIIDLKAAKDGKEVYDPGVTLAEFSKILSQVYKHKVVTKYAKKYDEKSVKNFRADLEKYLAEDKNFIVVNFLGTTGGHISPLAAYDAESDSVLVMDVALHKNPWYWTSVSDLYKAMNTKDGETYRGYAIISR